MNTSEIEEYLLSLLSVTHHTTPLSTLDTVKQPKDIIPPISMLHIYPGFSCILPGCGYCAQSRNRIYIHSRHHHPHLMGCREAAIQRFFDTTKSPYFEVSQSTPPLTSMIPLPIETMEYLDSVSAANKQAEMEADDALHTVSEGLGGKQQSAWLNHTGFTKHLAGIDARMLINQTLIPNDYQLKELPVESAIIKHLTSIFDRIHGATAGVPPGILELLSCDDVNNSGRKPFSQVQEITTWKRYTSYWSRLFIYLFAVYTLMKNGRCEQTHRKVFSRCTQGTPIAQDLDQIFRLLKTPTQNTGLDVEVLIESCMVTILKQRYDQNMGILSYFC